MIKIARIILDYVFKQYTIYNDVIEEYFRHVDTLLVEMELTSDIYEILSFSPRLDIVVAQIQRNNDFMKEYKRDRPSLQAKKIGLDKFKSHFVYKDIGDYFDFDSQRVERAGEQDTEKVLRACNTNGRLQENIFFTYLDQPGLKQSIQKRPESAFPISHIVGNKEDKPSTNVPVNSNPNLNPISSQQQPGIMISQLGDLHSILAIDANLPKEVEGLAKSRFESRLGSDIRKRNKSRTGAAPEIRIMAKVRVLP